jgi:phosphoribosylformylglycinamidine cyclo-ligase
VPPIFDVLRELGGLPFDELLRVFNMGLGMVVIAAPDIDLPAIDVGRVIPRQGERVIVRH